MKKIILVFMVSAFAGCATQKTPVAVAPAPIKIVDNSCKWVKPITVVSSDSLETKKQVLAHNLAFNANCKAGK